MSFLDRFQDKISTVTAHGHLKKADGSEEIRVGPYQPRKNVKAPLPSSSNTVNHAGKLIVNSSALPDGALSVADGDNGDKSDSTSSSSRKNHNLDTESRLRAAGKNSIVQLSGRSEQSDVSDVDTARDRPQISIRTPPPVPKMFPSPKDLNEKLVKTEQDRLAFSRKGRAVSFEPCNLAQYRKEKPSTYYELGHLQPDLNAEDLVRKRATQEKIRAFSSNLRTINKQQLQQAKSKKPEHEWAESDDFSAHGTSPKKAQSSRERALEFAKHLPKPRVTSNSARQELDGSDNDSYYKHRQMAKVLTSESPSHSHHKHHQHPKASPNDNSSTQQRTNHHHHHHEYQEEDDEYEDDSQLQMLQTRHHASKAQVEAMIRRR